MNEVLKYAMDPDDLSLFVRWFGPCLLTGNKAQKFLILVGKPETSKTLLLNVVEGIIGRHNTTALRTSLLHERFEIGRFADKTMLTAKDVDGDFLQYKSAHIVKLQTELEELEVTGDFAVAMTCNETLRCKVKGESDRGAWQRRAMIINFSKKALRRIAGFDEQLIKEEGPGILALAVKGAMLHLAELEDGGDFKMTAGQMLLVDKLLNESESAKFFVQKRIHREAGRDLTSEEINEAYVDFCEEMGWKPDPMDVFKRHLPDLMLEIYGSQKGTHGKRPADDSDDWTRRNVYTNVALNGPEAFQPPQQ